MSDFGNLARRYRENVSILEDIYVTSVEGNFLVLGPTPTLIPFIPGSLVLTAPDASTYEVTSISTKTRIVYDTDPGGISPPWYVGLGAYLTYEVILDSATTLFAEDLITLTKTELEVLVPSQKASKESEPTEICYLCGLAYPVSELAKVNGRWYCIPKRHAEEKLQ